MTFKEEYEKLILEYERLLLDRIYKMIYNIVKVEVYKEAYKTYHPNQKCKIMVNEFLEPYKSEMYNDFWDDYKNHLPLWSDINSNCYFKLKEN